MNNDSNNPRLAGQIASRKETFGANNRYAVFAVHTRHGHFSWFVTDAYDLDEVTKTPRVIRQAINRDLAVAG